MRKHAPAMTGLSARPRPAPTALRPLKPKHQQWSERAKRATEQIAQLTKRAEETRGAIAELAHMPQVLADKRHKLMNTLPEAESRAQSRCRCAGRRPRMRCAPPTSSCARPRSLPPRHAKTMPALGARLEASRQRHQECEHRIAETLQCAPSEIVANAGLERTRLQPAERDRAQALSLARGPRAAGRCQSARRGRSRSGCRHSLQR